MKARTEHYGFTVIELIVTIVMIGILGAVVISRFAQPNTFTVQAAQDGLLTTIRAAQQASLGRSGVTFEITLAGDEWQLEARDGSGPIRTLEFPSRNIVLQTGSAAASSDTCATAFDTDVENDFELSFSATGDLTQFVNDGNTELAGAAFNGVRICVNDTDAQSVCVSPAGYASAGNCND